MMLSIYMCCTVLSCSVWLCDPMDCSPPPLTMGFSRQEYWSGLWCPPPGYLPNPGIKTQVSHTAGRCFTFCATRGARVFIYAKVGSQETPGVTGKFGLRVQNEAGQRLIEFCQENTLVIANTLFNNAREDSTHGHHQMVDTEIRLIIFFSAKDGEALYRQQKQDWELTAAQIMNSLLPNSDLCEESGENH